MRQAIAALLAVAVLFGLLGSCKGWSPDDNALPVGSPVASFSLPDSGGQTVRLPTPGRTVLINYWASWCEPCLGEMPILGEYAQRNGVNGTQVVGIALDAPTTSRAWLAAHPQPYRMLLEMPGAADSSVTLGNTRGLLPYSVLVGPDGRVLASRTGPFADLADLEAWAAGPR